MTDRRKISPEEAEKLYKEMCEFYGHGEELEIAYENFKNGKTGTFDLLTSYHLDDMNEDEMRSLISNCDFNLVEEKPDLITEILKRGIEEEAAPERIYRLVDIHGGNLADIESERFDSLEDVVERLEIYITDVFFR